MAEVAVSVLDVEEKDALNVFYNIETAKIDYFHIDVMDGEFVQNENVLKMRDYALKLQSISMTPLDVHLMVKRPMEHIDYFIDSGADRITFHIEACENSEKVTEIIKYLKDNGIKVGIAINPETRAKDVYEYLPYIHMALVMSVVPGQGGQKFIETSIEKIKNIKKYCKENDIQIDIEVDGGINEETGKKAVLAGANVLVSGNYVLKANKYKEAINNLKNI